MVPMARKTEPLPSPRSTQISRLGRKVFQRGAGIARGREGRKEGPFRIPLHMQPVRTTMHGWFLRPCPHPSQDGKRENSRVNRASTARPVASQPGHGLQRRFHRLSTGGGMNPALRPCAAVSRPYRPHFTCLTQQPSPLDWAEGSRPFGP